jgi:hypothetical protein
MTNHPTAHVGCLLVGEYIDEAEMPSNLPFQRAEVVRPQLVANYVDLWSQDDGFKEFTVLLKDGRVVTVRGQGLKHLPASVNGESGSYGIVVRTDGEEELIALFKISEAVGIFCGEIRADRKTA